MDDLTEDTTENEEVATTSPAVSLLRWIALLPGALVSIALAMFPIHWLLQLIFFLKSLGSPDDAFLTQDGKPVPFFGIPFETIERLGYAIVLPALFILVGTSIAPTRKWTTAVSLAVLWVILMTAAITWAASSSAIAMDFTASTVFALMLNVGSASYALRIVYSEHAR